MEGDGLDEDCDGEGQSGWLQEPARPLCALKLREKEEEAGKKSCSPQARGFECWWLSMQEAG